MRRRYPSTMATQHPDNVDKYVRVQHEPDEAVHMLTPVEKGGLGIDEIMIDFEGKLTPYHQPSQVALGLIKEGVIPGQDVNITPRIPNASKESAFRQLMSIMALVETNVLAYRQSGVQAIIETVVPMIETGQELIDIQERINSVIELGNKNYDIQFPLFSMQIVPLIESVPALVNADKIIDEYYQDCLAKGFKMDDIRVMFARSDSAMSYGLISGVLAVLLAVDATNKWSEKNNVPIAPILGCGSLPFRGHLTLENLEGLMENYAGVRTYTVQSGLRYDHGEAKTIEVARRLKEEAIKKTPRKFSDEDIEMIKEFIGIMTKYYTRTFVKLIETVNVIAQYMPKNRDRLAASKHNIDYVREAANLDDIIALVKDEELIKELRSIDTRVTCSVPRAISYTAALYTLGTPPEFIGTGRCLAEIKEKFGQKGIDKLVEFYPGLKADLNFAGKYVNVHAAKGIIDEESRQEYLTDFKNACEILGLDIDITGDHEDEFYHTLLNSTRPILLHIIGKQEDMFDSQQEENKIMNEWIKKMGKIRGSLG
ncbi:MAG: phosphoenolpyruvate carboxylase [Erysipelotrichaceae bacterium]|nr:phosphoenolpyruvate carboxylase [Erysipelotrichaceae bacterium]MDD3809269.1 phosphoenolpyruvate carboxylase [Erysipelotrichaceae bacterium]